MIFLVSSDPTDAGDAVEAPSMLAAVQQMAATWRPCDAELVDVLYAREPHARQWQMFVPGERGWLPTGTRAVERVVPADCVVIPAAEARDYATAVRLHVDPNASVAMREHAAVRVRELLRRLSAVGTE